MNSQTCSITYGDEARVHERDDALDETEGGEESDQERDDGVGDAAAELVEVLEERHPPVERVLLVTER